ncbi:hypothetical protein CPB86DRAFT_782823 [Serendipita vermifera]|nr:hypothetical protein CPB86DRAFT_782823 [Serendipita vermifera]
MEGRLQGANSRRNRNSILQTAGDALGLRLNKRKRFSRQPTTVDDIILEISAAKSPVDYPLTPVRTPVDEVAERERLRDAAAQAVGLIQNTDNSVSFKTPSKTSKPHLRAIPFPSYPSSLSALQAHVQTASTLLKFYPSPTPFLILSRSKQWKSRHLVLTTPSQKEQGSSESYLHLFKTSNPGDKELERLTIHQDSVVYNASEEVGGGRRFVIKVAGKVSDAATLARKEEHLPAVWLLQLPDGVQMQNWIQYIKSAVLMQKAERAGLGSVVYQNTHNNTTPELRGDMDVLLSLGKQGLLNATSSAPHVNSVEQSNEHGNSDEPSSVKSTNTTNGPGTALGSVSAFKSFWNGRPSSRQMSISGSSVATALASHSLNSQVSAQLPTGEVETLQDTAQTNKVREPPLSHIFRSTSPNLQQSSINALSPPLSPTASIPFSEETTILSPSAVNARLVSPTASRAGHSTSFSVDWDLMEGASLTGAGTKRTKSLNQLGLAPPPPRKRPLTGSNFIQRQESPPKEPKEEEKRRSVSLQESNRKSLDEGGEIDLEAAMGRGLLINDEDYGKEGFSQELSVVGNPPHDLSPLSTQSNMQDDAVSQLSEHSPSPMIQPAHLPPPSISSFGGHTASKLVVQDQSIAEDQSRASSPSRRSESRDDFNFDDDHRDFEPGPEVINNFHLPTGSRRRNLNSVPPQLSPPLGPPPSIPSFHSPPFPTRSLSQEYSSSDRPGSSSSIPSTVPSLRTGLMAKRLSTMSTSDAPSVRSTDSANSASRQVAGSPFGTGRLSSFPGPMGPRSNIPPARPAPNTIPPPAPLDDINSIGGQNRHSLSGRMLTGRFGSGASSVSRSDSLTRRTRYSLGSAGPAPTVDLPPTPDAISNSPPLHPVGRTSMSSNGHAQSQSLFTIPGSPRGRMSASHIPAMAPPPIRPLPPTPFTEEVDRGGQSSQSDNDHRSSRSSTLPFSKMNSLKARLRMMSNPGPSSRHSRQSIPPAHPPPSFPLPATPNDFPAPENDERTHSRGYSVTSGESIGDLATSYSPPRTPIGEAIANRLDFPFQTPHNLPSPSTPSISTIPTYPTMARRNLPHPPDMTPLSPPPRRNSRASRDLTPQEKERWKSMIATIDQAESLTSPYTTTTLAQHSAINLPPQVEGHTD